MKLIAKERFSINGTFYEPGDEVKVDKKEHAIKLNELGYIEPLSNKDIQNFDKKEEKSISKKEKEDKEEKEETKWQI